MKKNSNTTIRLSISGMHCASCSLLVDDALEDLAGVHAADTRYATGEAIIQYDSQEVTEDQLIATISDLGYVATVADAQAESRAEGVEGK